MMAPSSQNTVSIGSQTKDDNKRNAYKNLVRNPEDKRLDLNWEDNIKMDLKYMISGSHSGSYEGFYLPG
jgi:hypothetical protein